MTTHPMASKSLLVLLLLALISLFTSVLLNWNKEYYHNEIDQLQQQVTHLTELIESITSLDQLHAEGRSDEQENDLSSSNYDVKVLAESRALSSSSLSSSSSFTFATDFGVAGDSTTDDTAALQAAIDSAATGNHMGHGSGGTVIIPQGVFRTTAPLILHGGVTLMGQGYGSSPLAAQFDAGSTTISYCGDDYAIRISGHAASVQNLAVYDSSANCGTNAQGGILVDANGRGVESITMSNVLIYFFMNGAALTLQALNNGGIAYGSFQNVRIRHAETGIRLQADTGSFVNSNSFIGGAISGAITEVGILAEGPGACNDNKFSSMVVEPPFTNIAHMYVTGALTNIKLLDTRLEGTAMASNKPLVIVDDSSYGNVMTGMLGHTHIQADLNRNPGIDMLSAKSIGLDPAPLNQFWNAAFKGWDSSSKSMPGWSMTSNGAASVIEDDEEELYANHHILSIDYLNYGGPFKLQAEGALPKTPAHSLATFGIYARTTNPNAIVAAMRYESGSIISSASHSGSGEWEFIGMSALYDKNAPYFYFSITGDVELTAPSFVYGQTPATPGASLMSSSGARMSGSLTLGVSPATPPTSGGFWVLPKNSGNTFVMDMQGNPSQSIYRINHLTAGRFPRGTIITLLFPEAGTNVINSAYIKLLKGQHFTSSTNSALTLMANGDPTWTEVSRNN